MRWGAGSAGRRGAEGDERLDTGGRAFGWVGLVVSVGLAVVWVTQAGSAQPLPVPVLTGALVAGVLFWAAILRPRVLVAPETLVLRNMLETVHVPLAAIEDHALRQVLAVRAGDKRYVASGVGRSLRGSALGTKTSRTAERGGYTSDVVNAADFVEARIGELAGDARDRAGITRYSDEQVELGRTGVRREPAWPVIAALVGSIAVLLASILLT